MMEPYLKRIRAMIAKLPETSEKLSHGAPTWWGGKKTFATIHDGHYDDGKPSLWIKAADGQQEALMEAHPARFFRPKYLGASGWVGIRLRSNSNWKEIEALLLDGYRLVAPKRALLALVQPDHGSEPAGARKPRKA